MSEDWTTLCAKVERAQEKRKARQAAIELELADIERAAKGAKSVLPGFQVRVSSGKGNADFARLLSLELVRDGSTDALGFITVINLGREDNVVFGLKAVGGAEVKNAKIGALGTEGWLAVIRELVEANLENIAKA